MPELTQRSTEWLEIPEPGIHYDVPLDRYLCWDAVNNSSLPAMARSAMHYRHALEHPKPPTAAMSLGSFTHVGILEPMAIAQRYVVMPDLTEGIVRTDGRKYDSPRATKEYKNRRDEFERVNADKQIVDQDTYDDLIGVFHALKNHEKASNIINHTTHEVCIAWIDHETGILCKSRMDFVGNDLIGDLKTCADVSVFPKAIANFGYHRQSAFYQDGMSHHTHGELLPVWLIAIEPSAPYGLRVALVSEEAIDQGRREYRQALGMIAKCREANHWPGYEDPKEWVLPAWAQAKPEATVLKVHGETVTI